MIELLLTFTFIADPAPLCPPKTLGPGLHDLEVSANETRRSYHVYVPKKPPPKNGWPLVISYHPAASSAAGFAATTHLRDKAEVAGFVLVEPEGYSGNFSKKSWNAGTCCGAASHAQIDDVAFTRAMLTKVKSDEVCVDDKRVFAVGHSNGGMFAHRLACEAADVFAAVASVSGALADVQDGKRAFTCAPAQPVAVLELHGTSDKCHPIDGGKGAGLDAINSKRSVRETMSEWRGLLHCSATTHVTKKVSAATCRAYEACPAGADVTLCELTGHGHGWPGSDKYELQALCGGVQTRAIVASDLVWSFFVKHPKP
jgi:polyhydroxybutyrate depolymerase